MIFADPPYFLSNDGITCQAGKMVSVNKGEWDKAPSLNEKHEFDRKWIRLCREVLSPEGTIWISGTLHNIYSIGMALEQEGFKIINNITWQKTNPPLNLSCRCFTHRAIKVELNIMNSLIGSTNIESDFLSLQKNPEILKFIPTLLAVRQNEIYAQESDGAFTYNFSAQNSSIEQYVIFMKKTGLMDLISKHIINNLVDYALGIETGLYSNDRKNCGGHQVENLVEGFIKKPVLNITRKCT